MNQPISGSSHWSLCSSRPCHVVLRLFCGSISGCVSSEYCRSSRTIERRRAETQARPCVRSATRSLTSTGKENDSLPVTSALAAQRAFRKRRADQLARLEVVEQENEALRTENASLAQENAERVSQTMS